MSPNGSKLATCPTLTCFCCCHGLFLLRVRFGTGEACLTDCAKSGIRDGLSGVNYRLLPWHVGRPSTPLSDFKSNPWPVKAQALEAPMARAPCLSALRDASASDERGDFDGGDGVCKVATTPCEQYLLCRCSWPTTLRSTA
eukprot:1004295-Prymnesium_polylepis.1